MVVQPANAATGVASYLDRLSDAARAISEILVEFPELVPAFNTELERLSGENGRSSLAVPERSNGNAAQRGVEQHQHHQHQPPGGELTHVERLIRFFVDSGNHPVPTPEIGAKSGMDKEVATNVLWSKKGRQIFQRSDHPTLKKVKVWKLIDEEFNRRRQVVERK